MSISNISNSNVPVLTNNKPTSSSTLRPLVRLVIGHTSKLLRNKDATEANFTHKWTVFVRATGPEQFIDRSFIKKVDFLLHPSFSNPNREVKKPPFELTEYGYGSFDMRIVIHFNGIQKSFKITYNLDLITDNDNQNITENKIEVQNPPPEFVALLQKYCRPQVKSQIHYANQNSEKNPTEPNSVISNSQKSLMSIAASSQTKSSLDTEKSADNNKNIPGKSLKEEATIKEKRQRKEGDKNKSIETNKTGNNTPRPYEKCNQKSKKGTQNLEKIEKKKIEAQIIARKQMPSVDCEATIRDLFESSPTQEVKEDYKKNKTKEDAPDPPKNVKQKAVEAPQLKDHIEKDEPDCNKIPNESRKEKTREESKKEIRDESKKEKMRDESKKEKVRDESKKEKMRDESKKEKVRDESKKEKVRDESKKEKVRDESKKEKVRDESKKEKVRDEPKKEKVRDADEPKKEKARDKPKKEKVLDEPKKEKVQNEPKKEKVQNEPKKEKRPNEDQHHANEVPCKKKKQEMTPVVTTPNNHSGNNSSLVIAADRIDRIRCLLDSLQADVERHEEMILDCCLMLLLTEETTKAAVLNTEIKSVDLDFAKMSETTLDSLERLLADFI